MRMTVKDDTEHVPYFALVPIGGGPDIRDTRQRKPVLRKGYLDAHILVSIKRKQMIDNGKVARRLAIAMYFHTFIDGGEVVQHLVRPVYLFFEKAEQGWRAIFRYPKRGYVIVRVLRDGGWTKPVANFLGDGRGSDHTSSGSLSTAAFCRVGRL